MQTDPATIQSHAFGDTHEVILSLMEGVAKGRVLDVAAGEGLLTYRLSRSGFDVIPADKEISHFKVDSMKPDIVDLNGKLPYKDGSFDYVLCIETFEHLTNPGNCLCEFYRILKPQGMLILSTPNISSLISRLIFLFTGQFANFFNTDASCVYDNGADRHILPLPGWLVERHMRKAGFRIEKKLYSNGGLEIPTRTKPWKKYVFLPHTGLFGNSLILKARKID